MLLATLSDKVYSLPVIEQFQLIVNAALISGCVCPDENQSQFVIDALSEKFRFITKDEFTAAFKMNIYGDFGKKIEHYNSFSMDYVVQVLTAYNNHKAEAVLKSEREAKRLEMEAAKTPTPNQLEQSRRDMLTMINLDFNNYKLSGTIPKLAAVKFDFLTAHNFIQEPTNQQKADYTAEARTVRLNELKAEKPVTVPEFKSLKVVLDSYEKNTLASGEQGEVKAIAKRLALLDWFDSLTDFPTIL
jgi:hypothetical protein